MGTDDENVKHNRTADQTGENAKLGLKAGTSAVDSAKKFTNNANCDFVTILKSKDGPVGKRFYRGQDEKIRKEDYQRAWAYEFCAEPVASLDDLARVVNSLGTHEHLVLGKEVEGRNPAHDWRRHIDRADKPATLEIASHYWLPFDIDGIEAKDKEGEFDFIDEPERAVRLVVSLLPPEFHMADCFWYLTSTAGFVKSADVGKGYPKIRLRLMFWLDRPLTCDQVKVWLADYIKEHVTKEEKTRTEQRIIDGAIYSPSQPLYGSRPDLGEGIADPVKRRSGMRQLIGETVAVPEFAVAAPKEARHRKAADRQRAPAGLELDNETDIERARDYLGELVAADDVAVAGRSGNYRTYQVANALMDWVSPEAAIGLILEEWNPYCQPPWECGDLEIVVGHAEEYRQNAIGCKATASNTYVARLRRIRDAANGSEGPRYDPPPDMPRFMSIDELDDYVFPVIEDVWQGFIRRQLVNPFYGDGKAGKTVLQEHIGLALSAGLAQLFDRKLGRHMPVVMILCEDRYERVQASLRAIATHLGINSRGLPLHLSCGSHDPLLAVIGNKGEFNGELTVAMRDLCKKIAPLGECLVVLDTVSDIAELDENLRLPPNTLFKKILQPICDVFGATIVVNCHPSATQMKSGSMTSGTTGWKNAARNTNALIVDEATGIRTLRNKYANYEKATDLHLAMNGPCFSVTSAPAADKTDGKMAFRRFTLAAHRRFTFDRGIRSNKEFAEIVIGPLKEGASDEERRNWLKAVAAETQSLKNARRAGSAYDGVLCAFDKAPGATEAEWRWFIVAGEEGETY